MKYLYCLILALTLAACGSGSKTNPDKDPCQRAGCSQQLCVPRDQAKSTASSCEWRPEYQCYGLFGRCGMQKDGTCGWFDTPDLRSCLQNPSGFGGDVLRQQLTPRNEPYIERFTPQTLGR